MPIDANLSFLTPPDVEVVVTDVGGGSGAKRVMDLVVSYDPAFLKYKRGAERFERKGLLFWRKVPCPSNQKTVKFKMERRKPGDTFLVVSAINPFTGKHDTESLKVPEAPANGAPGGKKKRSSR